MDHTQAINELIRREWYQEAEEALTTHILGERTIYFNDGTQVDANIVEVFVADMQVVGVLSEGGSIYNWHNITRIRRKV